VRTRAIERALKKWKRRGNRSPVAIDRSQSRRLRIAQANHGSLDGRRPVRRSVRQFEQDFFFSASSLTMRTSGSDRPERLRPGRPSFATGELPAPFHLLASMEEKGGKIDGTGSGLLLRLVLHQRTLAVDAFAQFNVGASAIHFGHAPVTCSPSLCSAM